LVRPRDPAHDAHRGGVHVGALARPLRQDRVHRVRHRRPSLIISTLKLSTARTRRRANREPREPGTARPGDRTTRRPRDRGPRDRGPRGAAGGHRVTPARNSSTLPAMRAIFSSRVSDSSGPPPPTVCLTPRTYSEQSRSPHMYRPTESPRRPASPVRRAVISVTAPLVRVVRHSEHMLRAVKPRDAPPAARSATPVRRPPRSATR